MGPALRAGLGFRTFHAFHFTRYRTDPGPAEAGGLDRGAVSGGAVAARAASFLLLPSGKCRDGPPFGPQVTGRNRVRPAIGILARGHRFSRRRKSSVRRLLVGPA